MSGRAKYPPGALAQHINVEPGQRTGSRLASPACCGSGGGVFTPRNLLIASCISHWVMTLGGGYTPVLDPTPGPGIPPPGPRICPIPGYPPGDGVYPGIWPNTPNLGEIGHIRPNWGSWGGSPGRGSPYI